MQIQSITIKSPLKKECEDALVVNDKLGIYGVLDGVTPLHDFRDENGHNPAYRASNLFKRFLEEAVAVRSLAESLSEANASLRELMLDYNVDLTVKHELWSTCAAIAIVMDGEVHYAQLGDCMIIARYRDGRTVQLTADHVQGISSRAAAKREQDRLAGLPVPPESSFADKTETYKGNRWMANVPGGYGVANGMPEAADFIQAGSLPIKALSHLILMTDGLFFPGESVVSSADRMLKLGLIDYAEQIKREETARTLRPDDKSAVILSF